MAGATTSTGSSNVLKSAKVAPSASSSAKDVDQILTNNQMRAETGSKSKWSIATSLTYSGGQLNRPFAEDRPNIAGATGSTDKTLIGGSISGKYAISPTTALLAGVGVRWLTPLQGTAKPRDYDGDKFDADNPYLNYQYIYRWHGVESVVTLASTYFTTSNLVKDGYLVSFGLSQNSVYRIPQTRLSIGANAYTGLAFYDKDDLASKRNQSDYSWGFLPFLEYQITDRLNLRTSWNLWIFEHLRSQSDGNTYRWDKVTQSLGLGISVTRDCFLYPNIQFLPDNVRSDRTTVALSANLNMF